MAAQITSVARAPGSMSVLVVDDCEPFLVPFGRALAEQGMVVQTAGSFAQAARIIGSVGLPTFLVSELRVCSHALLDFMKDVKDTLPADRFVVATRYPSIATAVHFTRIGVAGYLTKPAPLADVGPSNLGVSLTCSCRSRVGLRGRSATGRRSPLVAANVGKVP